MRLIKKRPEPQEHLESKEREESPENSTENTRKKILPNRPNRGLRMKSLQGKEYEEQDELYNLIFGEHSSDEDFNPSESHISEDESECQALNDTSENVKIKSSESQELILPEQSTLRLKKKNALKNNSNQDEEIYDLDLIDLDKIDEIEHMKDQGIFIESSEVEEESEEKVIKKKKEKKTLKKSKKTFIDHSDEENFIHKRSRNNKTSFNKANKKQKISHTKSLLREKINRNVTFKENYSILIVNKNIFKSQRDELKENIEYSEDQINNEYNEEEKYIEEENKNTRNIIKKYKKQEKSETQTKYTFLQEKMSQKELLLEAIFTEYYNNQSLIEMQRLEDLNKKELSTPGKKTFTEFVKVVDSKKLVEEEEGKEPNLGQKLCDKNYVYFSNPLVFNKIFENFNAASLSPKNRSLCVVTGLPAKYFDPLTKQPYATTDAFKLLRERYFQKEEDTLLFRIQTLSDLASQKKEKLKKILLSDGTSKDSSSSKNILNIMNKYGILKNETSDIEKKVVSRNFY